MTARASTRYHDHTQYGFWLVFDADGTMRFTRSAPSLGRSERAMSCTAKLPHSLFSTPQLKASFVFTDAAPEVHQVDIEAAAEALKVVFGVDIDLKVKDPE